MDDLGVPRFMENYYICLTWRGICSKKLRTETNWVFCRITPTAGTAAVQRSLSMPIGSRGAEKDSWFVCCHDFCWPFSEWFRYDFYSHFMWRMGINQWIWEYPVWRHSRLFLGRLLTIQSLRFLRYSPRTGWICPRSVVCLVSKIVQ